jgi:hypothetical protein
MECPLASWSTMADFSSPLLLVELLADIHSTISIHLDGVSGRWFLRGFQCVELLYRRGGGLCFASACVDDGGGWRRGVYGTWSGSCEISCFFKVPFVKGRDVLCFIFINVISLSQKNIRKLCCRFFYKKY